MTEAPSTHSLCWNCRAEIGPEPQCPHCVKLQPLGRDSDYFSVMGLPRKLQIDPRVLEPVFHALSRRFHPDVYRMASPRERMIALENSAVLNQAYRTLRDPFERAGYLVQLVGGRERENKAAPPQELFEEILEVQELLGEYQFAEPDEKTALRPKLEAQQRAFQAEQDSRAADLTDRLFTLWDDLQALKRNAPGRTAREGEAPAKPPTTSSTLATRSEKPSSPRRTREGEAPAEPPATLSLPALASEEAPILGEIQRLLGERAYLRRVLNSLAEALQ